MAADINEEDRERLHEKLIVWRGPLPFNVLKEPHALAEFAGERGAGSLVIDSLKDIVPAVDRPEIGGVFNQAIQEVIANEIDVASLHHVRKAQGSNQRQNKLDDVFGSVWVTAGTGSVVLIWGVAGTRRIDLIHLKQPMETVGPLSLLHDHELGKTVLRSEEADVTALLNKAGRKGITEEEAAVYMYETSEPPDRKRARRKLDGLVADEVADYQAGKKGGPGGGGKPARWFLKGFR